MTDYPKRKRNRLAGYDYSAPGAYFVTVCTHEKRCILGAIAVGALHEAPAVQLTEAGKIVRQVIESLPQRYPIVKVDNYVIMPNHIHLLLTISEERALREAPLRDAVQTLRALREAPLQEAPLQDGTGGKRALLGKAIGYLKMNSSKQIHVNMPAMTVWQRSFHDHVIRNDRDYQMIWKYIDENPAKWADDCFYPS